MLLSRDNVGYWLLFGALLAPICIHSLPYFQRPPRIPSQQALGPGITYQRVIWQQPRPVVLHVATVDLRTLGLGILVSPGQPGADGRETTAMTTSEFGQRYHPRLAVNASYFYPFQEDAPWAYYPRSGDRVNVVGQAISNGQVYSEGEPGSSWGMVCFDGQNRVQILAEVKCPIGTQQAVSGNDILLVQGQPRVARLANDSEKPYPRLVVATDQAGQRLWIVAVDGKQPAYSEGAKLIEMVPFLQSLGADTAINLDGGGSTTMVTAANGVRRLNAPIQNKIPMNERPVANHLSFFVRPPGNANSN